MTRVLLVAQTSDPVGCLAAIRCQLKRLETVDSVEFTCLTRTDGGAAERLNDLAAELDRCVSTGIAAALVTPAAVLSDVTLRRWLDDTALPISAVVSRDQAGHEVATLNGQVLAAGTAVHTVAESDAGSVGLIRLRGDAVPAVASAVRDALATGVPASWDECDLLDLVLTTVVRSSATAHLPISAIPVEPMPGGRVATVTEAERLRTRLAEIDAERLTLRRAARGGDGLYSRFILRQISARLTPVAVRFRISPNLVTSVSAIVGLGAAAAFAAGGYPALILGALLLQASIVLDCVDGEIARATSTRSAFGAWLDGATDRLKEYAALAGLAVGAASSSPEVWALATAGMVVQTTRHVQDFAFDKGVLSQWRVSFRDHRPLTDTSQWRRPEAASAGTGEPTSIGAWLRRLVHMPIGERWLALTLAALAGSPVGALVAYLALTGLAACWSLLGAARRTRAAASRIGAEMRTRLAAYRDDGVLSLVVGERSPVVFAAWGLPVVVTAVEGAAVIATSATFAPSWMPAAFGWFAVVAWHRYDIVYRRGGPTPAVPTAVSLLGGGWALRTAVLIAGAATGVLPTVLIVGILWLFVVYGPESIYTGARTPNGAGVRTRQRTRSECA